MGEEGDLKFVQMFQIRCSEDGFTLNAMLIYSLEMTDIDCLS